MAETDFAQFEAKTSGDRTVMHVLYGLHTIAWASMGTLAVIALIVNYIKRADEHDALYAEPPQLHDCHFLVDGAVAGGYRPAVAAVLFSRRRSPTRLSGSGTCTACLRGWLRFADAVPPIDLRLESL